MAAEKVSVVPPERHHLKASVGRWGSSEGWSGFVIGRGALLQLLSSMLGESYW